MKKMVLCVVCSFLMACSTPARMSVGGLENFKYNCDKRHEQYQFLENQKYSYNERFMVGMQMNSTVGVLSNLFHGTYQDSKDTIESKHERLIAHHQRKLKEQCRYEDSVRADNERMEKWARQRENGSR